MLMSSTISLPSSSSWATPRLRCSGTSLPCINTHHHHHHYHHRFNKNPTRKTQLRVSSSDNLTAVEVASPPPSTSLVAIAASATNVVRSFYEGINGRDLASVEELIAEKCVYEDLIFPRPFVCRQAILEFFKKFIDSISADLQFVIDDISIGVTWHLEWKGRPFPFSKGCSFYRLEVVNGKRLIISKDYRENRVQVRFGQLLPVTGDENY
ncbi:hypothetical protein ACOSQ4_009294 [Xanthoceras sorbifolium]